ncbi:cytochrome c-type biogenesis protein, partial [Paracandidimonas soli]|uniref:cytochrome c-type biogenesis protein n=1 Tax=Paracandidimonas soli TaxID=1917182 RepID=UPI0033418CB9
LEQGRSEQEIADYMVARYGDFVLYRPPMKTSTLLLWLGPAALLLVGLGALALRLRRRAALPDAQLSEDERRQARSLLDRKHPTESRP